LKRTKVGNKVPYKQERLKARQCNVVRQHKIYIYISYRVAPKELVI